jgi:hypothetical protein
MGTNRLEQFSDGVIAVAITLLVLGITVPAPSSQHTLLYAFGQKWPDFAAYLISFVTIGIIWINHHAMINRLAHADRDPGAEPVPADEYRDHPVRHRPDGQVPSRAARRVRGRDGVRRLVPGHGTAVRRAEPPHPAEEAQMFVREIPLARRRQLLGRGLAGVIPYALATALAFISPYITLAICGIIAAFYAHPVASGLEAHA